MLLTTERLILRPWVSLDARRYFELARDPHVGPAAGWRPHSSISESQQAISKALTEPETYAITLRETQLPIGNICLHHRDLAEQDDEAELGYWLGFAYWGRGFATEASRELLRHAFEDLHLLRVWCGRYEGNDRSAHVQKKLGFTHRWTTEGIYLEELDETRTGYVSMLTRDEWEESK